MCEPRHRPRHRLQLGPYGGDDPRGLRASDDAPGAGSGRSLMRLGIDARELSGNPTGVGRYLGGLLREWTAPDATHEHEVVLYSHRAMDWAEGRCRVRQVAGSGGT